MLPDAIRSLFLCLSTTQLHELSTPKGTVFPDFSETCAKSDLLRGTYLVSLSAFILTEGSLCSATVENYVGATCQTDFMAPVHPYFLRNHSSTDRISRVLHRGGV